MAAKGAIRDVTRALGISYDKGDKVAKAIPNSLGITLDKALNESEELKNLYHKDYQVKKIIDYSRKIEGLTRHASTHAAGVIITKDDITNYTPLYQSKGEVTTQYPMGDLESLGLLKMDFLGLRTLTVINKTLDLIKKTQDIELRLSEIPFDDKRVFEMLSTGDSLGVFQLESDGMRRLISKLKPEEIEDIIALLALYRPGPLGSGMVDDYIARRHGKQEIEYPHDDLKEILEPTYGVILYQEQVMQIAQKIAGYSLGEADLLRRVMGKKKHEEMKKHYEIFINGNETVDGAINRGYSQQLAEDLFELIEYFSGYGFNKAHSTAYAYISYQTAYFKAHYPVEFMAALMSSVIGNSDKVSEYIAELNKMEIEILPPNVNYSGVEFSVEKGKIRFGLAGIKNVGSKAIEAIIEARAEEKFKDLKDFCERVDLSKVNHRVIESLIKAGAFDSLDLYRSQSLEILEKVFTQAQQVQKQKSNGQTSFFDIFNEDEFMDDGIKVPEIEEFDSRRLLALEKEMLGFYLTGHPIKDYLPKIKAKRTLDSRRSGKFKEKVILGGLITANREILTKNHKKMSFVTLEDEFGEVEVIVFPNIYEKYQEFLLEDEVILVEGKLNDEGKVIASRLGDLSGDFEQKQNISDEEVLHVQLEVLGEEILDKLKEIFSRYKGDSTVYLHLLINDKRIIVKLSSNYKVRMNHNLEKDLGQLEVKYSITSN